MKISPSKKINHSVKPNLLVNYELTSQKNYKPFCKFVRCFQPKKQNHSVRLNLYGNFLEISTRPPTKSTVCIIIFLAKTDRALFKKTKSLQIGSVIFLEINTEHQNDYRLVLKISWKSTFGTLRTQSHYKLIGTQHQATDKVYSLVYNFSWPKRNGQF